ncbi:MAG: BRCT domain-containing protein [Candidatus Sumerlaeota bacterium]|nr:BRCT domain-containing protein [Candidatus Sumerlaeota bacterium]
MLLAHLCQIAYEQRQQGKRKEAEDLCFRYVSECPALLDARRAFIGAQRARTPFPGSALGAMRSYAESEDPDACPPLECLIRLRMEAGQHDQARALCDRALSFGLRSVQFKDWDAWKRGVERDRRKYGAPSLAQPLRGMTFVFTGTLETMIRKEAELRVEALGGYVSGVVNRDTRFLVCGKQSVSHKTTKLLAAEDENRKGASIRIIDEVEFLSLLQGDK